METKNTMREQHNREVQKDIDRERDEINKLQAHKDKYIPEITKLETRLQEINEDVRRTDIMMECGERKILVLSERFWKNNISKTAQEEIDSRDVKIGELEEKLKN